MIRLLVLYPKAIEPEKVEEISARQIQTMHEAPGLLGLQVSDGALMSPGGPSAYAMVLEASWASLEDFWAWTQGLSPADDADKDFILENGGSLLFYEVKAL